MSVVLILNYPGSPEKSRQVPVAAERAFETYWLPASRLLGLNWVPAFQGGFAVQSEDIPEILEELERLRQFLASEPPGQLPAGVAGDMLERIDLLEAGLREAQRAPGVEAFIG